MKVKHSTITLELEDKDVSAASEIVDMLDDLYDYMTENNANALFDDEGLLLSKSNIPELRNIFARLWSCLTVELCYSEHVKEMDEAYNKEE